MAVPSIHPPLELNGQLYFLNKKKKSSLMAGLLTPPPLNGTALNKTIFLVASPREATKKVPFLVAGPLRGGGLNGFATQEKITFFNVRRKSSYSYKPGGWGP